MLWIALTKVNYNTCTDYFHSQIYLVFKVEICKYSVCFVSCRKSSSEKLKWVHSNTRWMMAWISERCGLVRCFLGRFAFDQNFTAFSKRGQVIRTFPEKVSGENLRIVEFLIANHATENTVSKIKMERNLRQDSFVNLGIPLEIVLFWGNFWKCCSTRH